jgi:hypothetical protein
MVIERAVGISEKRLVPPVATLGDEVRQSRNDDAVETGYG